jgi:uncharacterized protein (DUF2225 family)
MMNEGQKLTFFEKKQTVCPICNSKFYREDLLSGGGRLIAGNLSPELRRLYEPSKKYGEVHPLIYPITVCPTCYFAALPADFAAIPESHRKKADVNADERHTSIALLFPGLDFTTSRTLREGVASYFFAAMCYDFYDKKANPTFKAGLCSLRAAWLLGDLHKAEPGENWDAVSKIFYRKARFYYQQALERESAGLEAFDANLAFGPDLDKNYGYYGVIFLAAYLEYCYGSKEDPQKRLTTLEYARRMMAKIFGVGKSSKNRPSAILDKAKEIYEQMAAEIQALQPGRADAEAAADAS